MILALLPATKGKRGRVGFCEGMYGRLDYFGIGLLSHDLGSSVVIMYFTLDHDTHPIVIVHIPVFDSTSDEDGSIERPKCSSFCQFSRIYLTLHEKKKTGVQYTRGYAIYN